MSVFRVEKNKNYTVISNYHLQDKNLSLRAIGLLSIILSLPENWNYTQAGLAKIVKDGLSSVSAGLNELEQYGYLVRTRERDLNGRLGNAIYTVYEMPIKKLETKQVPKSKTPKLENPILDNPKQATPNQEQPVMGEQEQLITNNTKTQNDKRHNQTNNQTIDGLEERLDIINKIKLNVGYEFFVYKNRIANEKLQCGELSLDEYDELHRTYNIATVDKIISYMADILTSENQDAIQIGEDLIDREVVRQKLMTIGLSEIKQVVFALNTTVIKNPKKYSISMLYNL